MCGPSILADGPDQSFHERMRQRNVRHRFDFLDLQDPQIGLPLMEPIQGIIVRTQIVRQCLRVNRAIEHAAQCHASKTTIDGTIVDVCLLLTF